MRSITIIFLLCLLASCSKKKPEEVADAIDVAQTYLSESKCTKAISLLEGVGRQNDDAIYLQVLASAYACRAGFSEINFLTSDVTTIDTSPSTDLMKSISILSTSNETATDSASYTDMQSALNVLLHADGGVQPSQLTREGAFGVRKAGDMGFQILFLTIGQLGKFLNQFGDVNTLGKKGAGTTSTNTCFLDYSYVQAQTARGTLPAATNACLSNTAGHDDLDLGTVAGKRHACEGLMLITNLIDVLNNIDLSGSDTLSKLTGIASIANAFKSAAITAEPNVQTLLETTLQSSCVTLLDTPAEVDYMQLIYVMIFEAGLE
ncbi:MAG TPA: hypothetical protein VNJ08_08140 [Bacteriovoracaceae bacterium]|nr:hypothetical protein [Bacteriovoracaceae bacterium]